MVVEERYKDTRGDHGTPAQIRGDPNFHQRLIFWDVHDNKIARRKCKPAPAFALKRYVGSELTSIGLRLFLKSVPFGEADHFVSLDHAIKEIAASNMVGGAEGNFH